MGLISNYNFVCDEPKTQQNKHKHNNTNKEAVTVFDVSLGETFLDHDCREGEVRWVFFGL